MPGVEEIRTHSDIDDRGIHATSLCMAMCVFAHTVRVCMLRWLVLGLLGEKYRIMTYLFAAPPLEDF